MYVLLTAAPGTGKTTVIQKLASLIGDVRLAGFYSAEIRERGERRGFRLVAYDGTETLIAHVVLEIEQAVFDRAAPFDRLRLIMGGRDGVAHRPRDGERPEIFHAVGQVAEALAELDRRRERRRALGDCTAAGAANLPVEPGGEDELVLGVAIEFERGRNLQIAEASFAGLAGRLCIDMADAHADGEAGEDRLGIIDVDIGLVIEGRDRRQRQLVRRERIVGGDRRRKEPLADDSVSDGRRRHNDRGGKQRRGKLMLLIPLFPNVPED